MIEEKRFKIISELWHVSESVIDNILALMEENKNTTEKIDESVRNRKLKLPMKTEKQKVRRTPIKGTGKPMSEMIIEDRR
jgi:hypothetical protein